MARPERFELPTSWFVAMRSIQLSYGRAVRLWHRVPRIDRHEVDDVCKLAEREGFEPSMGF